MEGLRCEREEVPEDVRVLDVLGRVTLLGVDEVGEFDGVAHEEDGRVVADLDTEFAGHVSKIDWIIVRKRTLVNLDGVAHEEDGSIAADLEESVRRPRVNSSLNHFERYLRGS